MGIHPGLEHSPSSWRERFLVLLLALLGLAISIYLALYQLGIIASPWDPIFGSASSEQVLNSFVSRQLPIPDAVLGVLGYLCEMIVVAIGDSERWRTKPWIVVLYGLIVLGMGLVSIGLVFSQAFLVQSWCFLCLLSAIISITILFVASREVFATLHYLLEA